MIACMSVRLQQRLKENPQRTIALVCKITFKQIVEVLFQYF